MRMFRKSPGFTIVAVLTLALGIGANTTIFSLINTLVLRPLPYPGADRLVLVWRIDVHDSTDYNILSAPDFWDLQKQSDVFESMAIFDSAGRGYNLSQNGEPERVSGVRVTSQFFQVLSIAPLLGRTFLPEVETAGRDHEVVLSYSLWTRRYGSDPAIVGKSIRIDGQDFEVVGVMPRAFQFQFWSEPRELWVPAGFTPGDQDRGSHSFVCIARLKFGVSVEQARAEVDAIGHRLMEQYPDEYVDTTATAVPLVAFGMENIGSLNYRCFCRSRAPSSTNS
jgi:putative ABC transport system permease protein